MTAHCATCRFFGAPGGFEDSDYNDADEWVERVTGHHYCARVIHGNSGDYAFDRIAAEPAVLTDGSGYAARLRVLPTFGCVLHEVKP